MGVTIATPYTTYLALPTEVSPTQEIRSTMTALFQKAIAQAHLTN